MGFRFNQQALTIQPTAHHTIYTVQLKWLSEPKGDHEIAVGKPFDVPCSATGQPLPTIEWTKLNGDGHVRNLGSEIRIGAVTQDDSGVYECRAKNGADTDLVTRINLSVLGK